MKAHDIDIALNLAHLIIADCNEELNRVHSDEAEAEIETIECVKFKATKIIACLKDAAVVQDERDTLLQAIQYYAVRATHLRAWADQIEHGYDWTPAISLWLRRVANALSNIEARAKP